MIQQDRDQDTGINIRFGSDRGKKGEYRLVEQSANKAAIVAGGSDKRRRVNGTSSGKRGAQVPARKPQLCAQCAAIETNRRGSHPRGGVGGAAGLGSRCLQAAKRAARALLYLAASLGLACLAWLAYEEFFDCFWHSARSLVYTGVVLMGSGAALLTVCKNGEFSVSSSEI